MSRYHSYLNSAKEILSIYQGEEPFAAFLKKYFARHKKFGSTDRKQISHLCYCYFRSGKALSEVPIEKRIMSGLFLCSAGSNEMLKELKPEWNEKAGSSVLEKCSMLNVQFSISNVFPWREELSKGIDHEKYCESFFTQPDLFLRIRPRKEKTVKEKLQEANINFKIISESCIALDNSTKIDSVIELDEEAVVQDHNSQQTARFLSSAFASLRNDKVLVWDCCAGSGGKSIMAFDMNPNIDLAVSDVRESILVNLKKRFSKAGIRNYKRYILDLTKDQKPETNSFDLIIADVLCTGSGTWSRTPEQLFYFNTSSIEKFSTLQQKIVLNVVTRLQTGGYFLYITCSVFEKENEKIVEYIQKEFHLELIKMEVLKGYEKKADTMFAALLRKKS